MISKGLHLLQDHPLIGFISGFFAAIMPLFETVTPVIQFISMLALCVTAVITAILKTIELLDKRKKKNADPE